MSATLEYTAPLLEDLSRRSLDIQALKDTALGLWRADKASARNLGAALIAVRDAMSANHGAFTRWYEKNGLDENRVNYCIRVVEGKVKRTVGSISASPSADYEKAVAASVRKFARSTGKPLEELPSEQITNLLDTLVFDLISTLRDKAGIVDNANQPPALGSYRKRLHTSLKGIVNVLFVEKTTGGSR